MTVRHTAKSWREGDPSHLSDAQLLESALRSAVDQRANAEARPRRTSKTDAAVAICPGCHLPVGERSTTIISNRRAVRVHRSCMTSTLAARLTA